MSKKAVLFSEMTPEPAWEAEFNDWYDQEHIPARMKAPGFIGAQRYRAVEGPAYLAVYDMADRQALATPEYQQIKGSPSKRSQRMLSDVHDFTRYIGEEISCCSNPQAGDDPVAQATIVYAVFFTIPPEQAEEFDKWYEEDHIPTLLTCPDWLLVRRFRILDGEPRPYTHLALHYLATQDALKSSARETARNSPWRARLAQQSWFQGHYRVFTKWGARFQPAN